MGCGLAAITVPEGYLLALAADPCSGHIVTPGPMFCKTNVCYGEVYFRLFIRPQRGLGLGFLLKIR